MSVTDAAREYAARIVALEPKFAGNDYIESLLFVAYLDGWTNAVKDERTFIAKLQETARSISNGP